MVLQIGCKQADCSLIGGETAEMHGMYAENEYDIAGFTVGIVDKEKMLNNENVQIGDKVIGIASSGVHSNGFSLIRKIFGFENNKEILNDYQEELGMPLGECLLTPTKIYVKSILELISKVDVKGVCNITGGGFYENMPRMLNEKVALNIQADSYEVPAIFKLMQKIGEIPVHDMYNTFNMGIGMAVIVPENEVEKSLQILKNSGEEAYLIGEVIAGNKEINIQ